jgi:hypothetical protein
VLAELDAHRAQVAAGCEQWPRRVIVTPRPRP